LSFVSGLKDDTVVSGYFDADRPGAEVPLTLTLDDKGFIGRRGHDELELSASKIIESATDRPARVTAAFAAGAKYKGRLSGLQGEDLGEVLLDVAEVRDSGNYVRALVHTADSPAEIVTYEGRLKNDPVGQVDGYCLELGKRNRGWHDHTLMNQVVPKVILTLRLSLDGKSVVGAVLLDRTQITETIKFTPLAADTKAVPLATEPFSTLIRTKMAKGAVWRGQYKFFDRGKTADISLRVMESTDERFQVELTSANLIGGRIVYEGMLRLDDAYVNNQFAVLQKSVGGKAPPPKNARLQASLPPPEFVEMFDPTVGRERMLYLVMSPEGDVLHGFSGTLDLVDLPHAETLTLRQTVLPKPSGVAAAPVAPKVSDSVSGAPTTPPAANAATVGATTPFGTTTPAATTPAANTPDAGPTRVWTSIDGKFTVTAGAVRLVGNNLTLRRADGMTVDVPLDRLSAADQDYVRKNPPRAE
jgi:hypothetical protein